MERKASAFAWGFALPSTKEPTGTRGRARRDALSAPGRRLHIGAHASLGSGESNHKACTYKQGSIHGPH